MDPGKCHILGFLKLVRYQVSLTAAGWQSTLQNLQISKISREWEHRDLEWKQDRELCKWKKLSDWSMSSCESEAWCWLDGRCQWPWNSFKMLSLASQSLEYKPTEFIQCTKELKKHFSMPDFDLTTKIQILSDEVDAFRE